MDSDTAYRLVFSLTGVGLFLMVLEIWMANYAMGTIGAMAVLGAIGLAFKECSIDVASLVLLGSTTFISLGFLLMLVYLPQSPLAKVVLARAAERARREAEEAENLDDDLDDELWGDAAENAPNESRQQGQPRRSSPGRPVHVMLPPLDIDAEDDLEALRASSKGAASEAAKQASEISPDSSGDKQA